MARTTRHDLDEMAKHLSSVTGLNITKGGAYGGHAFVVDGGREDLSGYMSMGALMDWAHAFLKGASLGYTKHKHDILRTGRENKFGDSILAPNLIDCSNILTSTAINLICGDCGTAFDTRHESSWNIGIAPFRWLCYSCWNKIQHPEMYETETPTKQQQGVCQYGYCQEVATYAIERRRTGKPFMVRPARSTEAQFCEKHAHEQLDYQTDDFERATA